MSINVVSKEELMAAGWKTRQIDAVLDEPDEVGPSGHWLNTSGKPYYNSERVAVAAYRIGLTKKRPTSQQWEKWAFGQSPTSTPVMTFDFHRIVEQRLPKAKDDFWALRLSHPVIGRRPGTLKRERELIRFCLTELAKLVFAETLETGVDIEGFLQEKSKSAAQCLGDDWPEQIVFRQPQRSSYISRAVSNRVIQRFLYALSLIHTGSIKTATGQQLDAIEALVWAPKLRFDVQAPRLTA